MFRTVPGTGTRRYQEQHQEGCFEDRKISFHIWQYIKVLTMERSPPTLGLELLEAVENIEHALLRQPVEDLGSTPLIPDNAHVAQH